MMPTFWLLCALSLMPLDLYATPQFPTSTVQFGYSTFQCSQAPLEQLFVKEGKPLGKRNVDFSTANHLGYVSSWKVRDGVLYLEKFEGNFEGKPTSLDKVLGRKLDLPCRAEWFTGVLHCPIGEPGELYGVFDVIVQLNIEKGKLTKVTTSSGQLDGTIDGLQQK